MKGNIILLIAAAVWGSGFIAQSLGNHVMPPMTFNSTRQLMGALVMLPLAIFSVRKNGYFSKAKNTDSQIRIKIKRMALAAVSTGGFIMIATNLQQIGLITASVGKVGFISVTYVVFVPLIGALFGQRPGKKAVMWAFVALLGFAVMSLRFDGGMTQGDWLSLISAVVVAFQVLAVGHFVDKDNSILLTVLELGFSGLSGLIVALIVEHPSLEHFQAAIPLLLYIVFIPTIIGYTGQIIGQKYADPTTTALILSLEAVFAAIFGVIFLGEMMSLREIMGSIIIFAAVIFGQLDQQPKDSTRVDQVGLEEGNKK